MDAETRRLLLIISLAAYFSVLSIFSASTPYLPNNPISITIYISIIIGGLILILIQLNNPKLKLNPDLDRFKAELKWYKLSSITFFSSQAPLWHLIYFYEIQLEFVYRLLYGIIALIPLAWYVYVTLKMHKKFKTITDAKRGTNWYWILMLLLVTLTPYGFAEFSQSYSFFSLSIVFLSLFICGIGFFRNYYPEFTS